jgi:hypothetical protein
MAIGDYLSYLNPTNYNVFGVENPTYSGLLGPEQSQALSKQSNIAGLLGSAAALTAGMGRGGPRRSAAQNIIGALGAGYGASGQAYQGGIEQMANAQKLAQLRLQMNQAAQTQQAIEGLINDPRIKSDPLKVAYIRSNPSEALKLYSELLPIQEAAKGTSAQPPVQPTVPTQVAVPAPVVASVPVAPPQREYSDAEKAALADMDARIAADPLYRNRAPQAVPTQPSAAVPIAQQVVAAGENQLQGVNVTAKPSRAAPLIAQQNALLDQMRIYSDIQFAGNPRAKDIIENANKSLEQITKQINKISVEEFDFSGLKRRLPAEYAGRVDDIQQNAGAMSMNELIQRTEALSKEATEFKQKTTDYTNEVRRTAAELYPKTPLNELNADQMKRLNAVLLQRDKEARRSGAPVTNIDMGQKTVAIERAKAQVASETAAEGALAVAGDVRAIVDVLKPYKGGKFDELKASLGAYFPDTSLAKMASAADIANALRAKIAPTLRVPGSGATSDFEMKQFMAAIPSLAQYPEGRELLATYTQRFADRSAAAADIKAKMIEDGTYSLKAFQQELKNAGYERILTPEDLQKLNVTQAPVGTPNLSPAGQRAFDKYKRR